MPGIFSFTGFTGLVLVDEGCGGAAEFEERLVLEPEDLSISPRGSELEELIA